MIDRGGRAAVDGLPVLRYAETPAETYMFKEAH